MAFRSILKFRKQTMLSLPSRARPAASEEIVEPPKGFYIVKDYNRNPFYMSIVMAAKPGYKKVYDPFKKYTERRLNNWEPRYKHHQMDIGLGWSQLAFFIFILVQFFACFHFEAKVFRLYHNPLAYNCGKPTEF